MYHIRYYVESIIKWAEEIEWLDENNLLDDPDLVGDYSISRGIQVNIRTENLALAYTIAFRGHVIDFVKPI